MYIARILYPVHVLGPGNRVGIWFAGCPHGCEGCANPELWEQKETQNISMDTFLDLIERIGKENKIDGFTITGGEPFFQHEDLTRVLKELTKWSTDILVFSGFYREELEKFASLDNIAVLVDGPYQKELNYGLTLRGSINQTVHILMQKYEDNYKEYLLKEYSEIQNFVERESVISVGIHKPDFAENIGLYLKKKGLLEGGNTDESVHTEMA